MLIFCSRLFPSGGSLSHVDNLLDSIEDWSSLIKQSAEEGVSPLLYKNLKLFHRKIPDFALERLRAIYLNNTGRNIYLIEKVKPLLQAINDCHLKVAVTKGARLAQTLYQDLGLRPFVDIDLVVHSGDWPKFEKLLRDFGYSPEEEVSLSGPKIKEEWDWTFRPNYRKGRLILEIHFHYLGLHFPSSYEEDFWENTQDITIEGEKCRVLSPEYELCYLCLHAMQHSYGKLIWLTDIAELSAAKNLNWDKVILICRREKIYAPVYYALHLVNILWPQTVSRDILERFRVSPLERWLLQFSWPEEHILERTVSLQFPYYAPTLFSLIERKKPVLFLKTLLRIYFPSRRWVASSHNFSVNSPKVYLHYAWRLSRPILLFARRLLKTEE